MKVSSGYYFFGMIVLLAHHNALSMKNTLPLMPKSDTQDGDMPQLFNFLRAMLANEPNIGRVLPNIFGQNISDLIEDFLSNPFESAFNSSSQFRTAIENAIRSPLVQQMIKTGEIAADTYVGKSLEQAGVSHECYNDLKKMGNGLFDRNDWALRMLDALAKPGSNLMNGNMKLLGSYDECVALKAIDYKNTSKGMQPGEQYFSGKYCKANIPISFGQMEGVPIQPKLEIGMCVPNSCKSEEITGFILQVITLASPNITQDDFSIECQEKRPLDAPAIVAICILGVLGVLILVGTLYDIIAVQMNQPKEQEKIIKFKPPALMSNGVTNSGYIVESEESNISNGVVTDMSNGDTKTHEAMELTVKGIPKEETAERILQPVPTRRGTIEKMLLSFSVYSNGVKILSTNQASGSLGAVNGIRFLSMAWVILGHSYFFAMNFDENLFRFVGEQGQTWEFNGIVYSTVAVDTFFALSGLLVAYLTLKELKKAGGVRHFNWFMFYFHRFWRLTPAYMLVIMVFTCLMKFWGSGPMWPTGNVPYDACKDSWWTNILYVNNFVNLDKMCVGWTWYLADDMQYYVVSPLILIPLFYQVVIGGVVSLLFLIGTVLSTALIVMNHHYSVQGGPYVPKPDDQDYNKLVYIPCYARMGPYIVGLFTGYILYRMKCQCRMPKMMVLFGWLACLFIVLSVIYGPYTEGNAHIFSLGQSAVYYSLARTGWGIAVCWIVFACATGYGGWINELLSWKAFIPLGRLTFCAYLLHPIIQLNFYMSRRHPSFFNNYELIYMFIPNLVMSYGVAFLVSLAFESPMMGLEKAIFKRDRRS